MFAVFRFASTTVDSTHRKFDQPPASSSLCVELDAARLALLAPDRVLISLKGGEVGALLLGVVSVPSLSPLTPATANTHSCMWCSCM